MLRQAHVAAHQRVQREVRRLPADERVRRGSERHAGARENTPTPSKDTKETPSALMRTRLSTADVAHPREILRQSLRPLARATSHSELNNVNERSRNFMHRFKELARTSGKRDSRARTSKCDTTAGPRLTRARKQ